MDEGAGEIGRYRLIAELARGGMGVVHLAVAGGPAGFHKLLVVKELRPELARDDACVAMFLDEARLAARLSHRNLVQTLEVGSEGERHFLVMEYLEGRSLQRLVRRLGPEGGLTVGAYLRIVAGALAGLHHAHELRDYDGSPLGVVHRDVSPMNVMVTFDGQVKLLDFGIAKSAQSTQQTKTGILKGRVAYMAPEQACAQSVDRRTDVYAAGVMIWEGAARRRLWQGLSEVQTLSSLLREGPPPLREVCPDAPAELEAICLRATARDPDARYATAAELLDRLEEHLGTRADVVGTEEIGARAVEAFSEERVRTRALVEEALARMRTSGHTPSARVFSVPAPLAAASPWWASRRAVGAALAAALLLLSVALGAALRREDASPAATRAPAPLDPPSSAVAQGALRRAADVLLEPAPARPAADAAPTTEIIPRFVVVASAPRARAPAAGAAAQPPASTPAPSSAAVPVARADVAPTGGRAPLRPIVTSNPYGTP